MESQSGSRRLGQRRRRVLAATSQLCPARQIRKHRAFTLDSSTIKNTRITERFRIQFRAEAFNLFNHNYYGRDDFNTDPFGTLFPALGSNHNTFPRQVQLGIKAYW